MDMSERTGDVQQRHPWETARSSFFLERLRECALPSAPRCLDVGAGDAFLAEQLRCLWPTSAIVCWDVAYTPQDLAALAQGMGLQLTRDEPEGAFDVLLLLDVLEHIEDDRGFLAALVHRRLRPGGVVLISVPAWPRLYSAHDVKLRHYRRYRPRELHQLVNDAGLSMTLHGGVFGSLLPIRVAECGAEMLLRGLTSRPSSKRSHTPASSAANANTLLHQDLGTWRGGVGLTAALRTCLRIDGTLSARFARGGWPLPGLSCFAVCQKPA